MEVAESAVGALELEAMASKTLWYMTPVAATLVVAKSKPSAQPKLRISTHGGEARVFSTASIAYSIQSMVCTMSWDCSTNVARVASLQNSQKYPQQG